MSKEDRFTEPMSGSSYDKPYLSEQYEVVRDLGNGMKIAKISAPSVREIQLEQLVRKFMRCTMTMAGAQIREAHADAREMGIR